MTPQERLADAIVKYIDNPDLVAEYVLKRDPTLAAAIELGTEWELTEAALPEGWKLDVGQEDSDSYWADAFGRTGRIPATGPTPAAALRALREKLGAPPENEGTR